MLWRPGCHRRPERISTDGLSITSVIFNISLWQIEMEETIVSKSSPHLSIMIFNKINCSHVVCWQIIEIICLKVYTHIYACFSESKNELHQLHQLIGVKKLHATLDKMSYLYIHINIDTYNSSSFMTIVNVVTAGIWKYSVSRADR